jgi:hypothetical protein
VTGVTSLNIELAPKRLELLHELLPSVTSMAPCNAPRGIVTSRSVQTARSTRSGEQSQ